MGSFTSCLSGDAPAGDERSGKPGITANGDGEISTLGNLRSAVSATGPGVPERMECSRVVESQWASSAQQLGTTLALLRLVSPASLSKLGTLTLAEAISTLVCVSTRNSGQQQVISDEEVMVVLRSEWTEEAMLLQQTPNYPMPSASAQHGHAFLQVVQAAGPWSAGGVLSLAQQCTLRMRMELANVNSNEALGSAVTSWKQGVQGVVVLPRGAGTLHFRSAYVEDADGVLAPSLLVRLASTAPPPTLTPGPSPLPQPRLLGPHSTGRVLKKDPSIRSMGIKLDRKAVMQLALGEVLAAPAPDAGRQGSFDANGSSDVFGLMDAVTAANESSVSGVLAVMAPTLHRLHSILSNVPLIISLLDPNGGVIFQNDLSRSYWGNLATELGDTGPRAMEMLEAVLSAEPGLVEEVMENIAHGILWKKVLRVPLVCGLTRGAVEPIFEPMETEEGGTETDVGASSGVSFDVQTPPAGPEFGGPAASSPDASSRSIVGSTLFAPTVPSPGIRAAFASDPHSTRSSALPETASTSANANAFDETIRSGALPRPRGGTNFMSFVDYGPKSCDVRSAEIGSAVQPSAKLLSIMMPKASPSKGATRVSDSGIDRPSGQAYKPSPAARARNGGMSMDYGPRSEALAKIVEKPVSGGAIRGGSDGQLFGGVGTRDPATLEVLLQCGSVDDPGAPDSANNSCSQVPAVVGLGTSAAPTYQSQRSLDEASAEMIKPGDNVGSLLELQQWTFQQAVSHEAGAVRRGEREQQQQRQQSGDDSFDLFGDMMQLVQNTRIAEEGSGSDFEGIGGSYTSSEEEEAGAGDRPAWHYIEAIPMVDPVTGKEVMMLIQMDVSVRAEMEERMTALTEAQLTMLEQMFPRHVLEYMIGDTMSVGDPDAAPGVHAPPRSLAASHSGVTILFMDIVGFTTMSKEVEPAQVMLFLNSLFTLFDELIDQYDVYKVETAGDCYIVAGALMCQDKEGFLSLEQNPDAKDGAEKVMTFAKAMLRCARTVKMPHNGETTRVRVGMHTGDVVTGLIGTKLPKFSIFGDTMNTASRMESTCPVGCIQVSEVTHELLSSHTFNPTGGVEVKGKGLMETYLWVPEAHPEEEYQSITEQAQEQQQQRQQSGDDSFDLFGDMMQLVQNTRIAEEGSGSDFEGIGGSYTSSEEEEAGAGDRPAWHYIEAIPMVDPVTGKEVMMLIQMDVSVRAEMEERMTALTEAQLTMLEQMFPRHVLEYMIGDTMSVGDPDAAPGVHAPPRSLAASHSGVTILFMDIVGFTTMSKEVEPAQVMLFLNSLFTLFDELIDQYDVYKVSALIKHISNFRAPSEPEATSSGSHAGPPDQMFRVSVRQVAENAAGGQSSAGILSPFHALDVMGEGALGALTSDGSHRDSGRHVTATSGLGLLKPSRSAGSYSRSYSRRESSATAGSAGQLGCDSRGRDAGEDDPQQTRVSPASAASAPRLRKSASIFGDSFLLGPEHLNAALRSLAAATHGASGSGGAPGSERERALLHQVHLQLEKSERRSSAARSALAQGMRPQAGRALGTRSRIRHSVSGYSYSPLQLGSASAFFIAPPHARAPSTAPAEPNLATEAPRSSRNVERPMMAGSRSRRTSCPTGIVVDHTGSPAQPAAGGDATHSYVAWLGAHGSGGARASGGGGGGGAHGMERNGSAGWGPATGSGGGGGAGAGVAGVAGVDASRRASGEHRRSGAAAGGARSSAESVTVACLESARAAVAASHRHPVSLSRLSRDPAPHSTEAVQHAPAARAGAVAPRTMRRQSAGFADDVLATMLAAQLLHPWSSGSLERPSRSNILLERGGHGTSTRTRRMSASRMLPAQQNTAAGHRRAGARGPADAAEVVAPKDEQAGAGGGTHARTGPREPGMGRRCKSTIDLASPQPSRSATDLDDQPLPPSGEQAPRTVSDSTQRAASCTPAATFFAATNAGAGGHHARHAHATTTTRKSPLAHSAAAVEERGAARGTAAVSFAKAEVWTSPMGSGLSALAHGAMYGKGEGGARGGALGMAAEISGTREMSAREAMQAQMDAMRQQHAKGERAGKAATGDGRPSASHHHGTIRSRRTVSTFDDRPGGTADCEPRAPSALASLSSMRRASPALSHVHESKRSLTRPSSGIQLDHVPGPGDDALEAQPVRARLGSVPGTAGVHMSRVPVRSAGQTHGEDLDGGARAPSPIPRGITGDGASRRAVKPGSGPKPGGNVMAQMLGTLLRK